MAAAAGGETVKSPGQLTLTLYASCPDITLTVTPGTHPYLSLSGPLSILI
jgi:hypothetical protein